MVDIDSRLLLVSILVDYTTLHKNNWVNRLIYCCHNFRHNINDKWMRHIFKSFLSYLYIYYFYAYISIYSWLQISDIQTPDIRTIEFTGYFIWEQIFYLLFCLGSPTDHNSLGGFSKKKFCLSINFASFNWMLKPKIFRFIQ